MSSPLHCLQLSPMTEIISEIREYGFVDSVFP